MLCKQLAAAEQQPCEEQHCVCSHTSGQHLAAAEQHKILAWKHLGGMSCVI